MSLSTAVDASAVARVVGIKTEFKNLRNNIALLPMRIAVLGQGNDDVVYTTTKRQVFSALEAGQNYGFGSPIHLAVAQLLPDNGKGVGSIPVTVYPLSDGTVKAVGTITPSGTITEAGSFKVRVSNIETAAIAVTVGMTVAQRVAALVTAINAKLDMPVVATDTGPGTSVTLTSKWAGASANAIYIEVIGPTAGGAAWAVVQPTGGSGNPSVSTALTQIGNVWETMLLNCLDVADDANLDAIQTAGEDRWGALVRKPFVSFYGVTIASVSSAIAVSDARKTDKVNVQLVAPGSHTLPFVVAAAQLTKIAVLANNNPAHDYGSLQVTAVVPGTDAEQWTYPQRDTAVKAGSSTTEVRDGIVTISDVVTCYHPTGDANPAYRYVVDVVKVMNILFNLDIRFATPEWDGAPLIPDDQPTANPTAKKPKMAVAEVCAVIDSLGLEAIISDTKFAKENTFAEIDSSNPKRMNLSTTMKISGNSNIISVDFNFGFYFGSPTVVA